MQADFQPVITHSSVVSAVYRESSVIIEFYGCNYHRQGLEAAILVHLFVSSPLFSLYGSPLFSSIDLVWTTVQRQAVKLYQLNDQPFLLLTLAEVSKATPTA